VRRPHEEEKLVVDRDLHGKRHLLINRTDITDDASERNEDIEVKEKKEKSKESAQDALETLLEINEAIAEVEKKLATLDKVEGILKRGEKLDAKNPEHFSMLVTLGLVEPDATPEEAQAAADSLDQNKIDDLRRDFEEDRDNLKELQQDVINNNPGALEEMRLRDQQQNSQIVVEPEDPLQLNKSQGLHKDISGLDL